MIHKQVSLYPFYRLEAYAWAATGLVSALAIQILSCTARHEPVTWQKLLLSSVAGPIGGLVVWLIQFPLRWWLLLVGLYELFTPYWKTFMGEPWPLHLGASAHYPVWLACGVAGSFLYSRWLYWKCHDYPEGLTPYLCFWGSYLGPVALVLGVWYSLRRWREKKAFAAYVALQRAGLIGRLRDVKWNDAVWTRTGEAT